MSTHQQQRMVVEQLRREAGIRRIPVSQAVEDLMQYTMQHKNEDSLLVGFHNQRANPFREKSSCAIL